MDKAQTLRIGLDSWWSLQSSYILPTTISTQIWPNYTGVRAYGDPHRLMGFNGSGSPSVVAGPGWGLPAAVGLTAASNQYLSADRLMVNEPLLFPGTPTFWDKSFTLNAWAYLTATATDQGILGVEQTDKGAELYFNSSGTNFAFALSLTTGGRNIFNAAGSMTAATWHMLTGIIDWVDSTHISCYFYRNGVLEDSGSFVTNIWAGIQFESPKIGYNSDSGGRFLGGRVAGCGVWNRALSQPEIVHLYNNGNGLDYPFVNPRLRHRIRATRGGRPARRTLR